MRHGALILLGLAACTGGGQSPDPEPQIRTTGRFCLVAASTLGDGSQNFVAGEEVQVEFSVNDCLSSSCTADERAECSVSSSLGVTAEASWTDLGGTGIACTDDCGRVAARCSAGILAAGSHRFGFLGGGEITLEIPSVHLEGPCIDTD